MRALLLALVVCCTSPPARTQVSARSGQRELFVKKRDELVLQQSQVHLEYGLELRKQGLPTQATAQILLAAEVGDGKNPGADSVLSLMRRYDEAFWKRHGERPSRAKVAGYEKKARDLTSAYHKQRLELGHWAHARELEAEARAEYEALLRERDQPLVSDAKGQLVLPLGTLPADTSQAIRADAISINGELYLRDEVLTKLGSLTTIFEASDASLRVRTTSSEEQARALHALGSRLLPELERELGAAPSQRLALYAFARRSEYEAALSAFELSERKLVDGLALPNPPLAFVCLEGQSPDSARGLLLHELTHVYMYGLSRVAFPSWYAEGYAETFGGPGTFTWDGTSLTAQGLLPRAELKRLARREGLLALRDLVGADALEHWKRGPEAARAFYSQAWALLRFLRSAAPPELARRFRTWEQRCRGQLLGVEPGRRVPGPARPAAVLFLELFGAELTALEDAFHAWLPSLL